MSSPTRGNPQTFWQPWVAGGLGMLATLLACLVLLALARKEEQLRFEVARQRVLSALEVGMERNLALLRGGAGLFAADDHVDPHKFYAFAERLQIPELYVGIQGIGYAQRVLPEEKDAVTSAIRAAGWPDFKIWPEWPREEYYTITALYPQDRRNKRALGFDMFSEPVRRAAMARARDTGQAAMSAKVRLVQERGEEKQQAGFLIYLPVYQGGAIPPTVEERRRRLKGFVYSPYRADDLMRGILGSEIPDSLGLRIYDGETATTGTLLHESLPAERGQRVHGAPRFRSRDSLLIAGHRWTVEILGWQDGAAVAGMRPLPVVGVGGTLFSLALFLLARRQARARSALITAEEQAAEHSERLAVTLASIADGVVVADSRGRVSYMNPVAETISGWSLEEAKGLSVERIIRTEREETGEPVRNAAAQALDLQEVVKEENPIVLFSRDGRTVPVAQSAAPVRVGRELIGVVLVLRDVAERRRQERMIQQFNRDLAEARDQALEASRAKSAFLANMSHELRTPLNAIIGYAELLEEEVEELRNAHLLEDLRKIQEAGQHLLTLINGILDLSKIEAGKMELQAGPFEVGAVVDQVVSMVQPLMLRSQTTLESYCPPGTGMMVSDETKVRQILFNLLSNAAKFTERGSVSLHVERVTRDGRDWIDFHVTDTGIGMSEEEMGRLFREFSQVDSSATRRYGGTGLGLVISRRFAEMLGGTIEVRSRKGQGSRFIVRLPADLHEA